MPANHQVTPRPLDATILLPSDAHKTLEERRAARIKERRMLREVKQYPRAERKDRHRAMVFFATCDTKTLIAVMQAVEKTLKKISENPVDRMPV